MGLITENEYFKLILNRDEEFLPFIVDKIIKGCGIFAHRLLFSTIIEIEYGDKPIKSDDYKKLVKEWCVKSESEKLNN